MGSLADVRFDHVAQQVPDIGEAVAWWRDTFPGVRVLHEDPTWALIEACGLKLAFVLADQHPGHLAWRVDEAELERLASDGDHEIRAHRDGSRSFYVEGPGGQAVEVIAYPPP